MEEDEEVQGRMVEGDRAPALQGTAHSSPLLEHHFVAIHVIKRIFICSNFGFFRLQKAICLQFTMYSFRKNQILPSAEA